MSLTRKLYILYLYLFICVVGYGCSFNQKELSKKDKDFRYVADINDRDHKYAYDSLISGYSYIPLETGSSYLVGEIKSIVPANGRFYIVSNNILCFDNTGQFLFKIDKVGRGPGEYFSIDFMSVDQKSVYIFDYNSSKILTFNAINGEYVSELRIPYYVKQAVVIGGNRVVMNKGTLESERLKTSDRLLVARLNDFFAYEGYFPSTDLDVVTPNQLTYSNARCYWIDVKKSGVYGVFEDQKYPVPYFKLYDVDNTVSNLEEQNNDIRMLTKMGKPVFLDNFMDNETHIYCTINIAEHIYGVIYNKKYNKTIVYNLLEGIERESNKPAFAPITTDGEYMYSVVPAFIFHHINENRIDKSFPTKRIRQEDNPVIIKFSLK